MESGPSRTAMLAAMGRAVHLLAYGHRALVHDWLAYPLLGPDADTYLDAGHRLAGDSAVAYATWHAARVRLTEDWLAASQAQQYVILGAGLDSFAWRHGGTVRTYGSTTRQRKHGSARVLKSSWSHGRNRFR